MTSALWKSQDSVHRPQFLKRKENHVDSKSNQGPSAYQPNAVPLGQTQCFDFYSLKCGSCILLVLPHMEPVWLWQTGSQRYRVLEIYIYNVYSELCLWVCQTQDWILMSFGSRSLRYRVTYPEICLWLSWSLRWAKYTELWLLVCQMYG